MQASDIFKNPIFAKASSKAGNLLSNRFRFLTFLSALLKKVNTLEDKKKVGSELKEKIFILGRLLKASLSGTYKSLPWKSALSIAAALIYFVNPADVIPDVIPFSGFLDDFTILVWTYNSFHVDLEKFKQWEQAKVDAQ